MTTSAISGLAPLPKFSPQVAKQLASTPTAAAPAPRQPTYATPVIKFDNQANIPVELIRDPMTGAVTNQIPSAQVVEKYRRHELPQQTANRASSNTPAATPTTNVENTANTGSQASTAGTGATAVSAASAGPNAGTGSGAAAGVQGAGAAAGPAAGAASGPSTGVSISV